MGNNNSIIEARRRVRKRQEEANAARALQDRQNRDSIARMLTARDKLSEVAQWKSERRKVVLAQLDAEAEGRCGHYRSITAQEVSSLQARGETMASIAGLAEITVNEVRSLARSAPKPRARKTVSRALDQDAMRGQSKAQAAGTTELAHDATMLDQ